MSSRTCRKPNRKAIIVAVIAVACLVHILVLVPQQHLHQYYNSRTGSSTILVAIDSNNVSGPKPWMIQRANVDAFDQSSQNITRNEASLISATKISYRTSSSTLLLDLFWKVDQTSNLTSRAGNSAFARFTALFNRAKRYAVSNGDSKKNQPGLISNSNNAPKVSSIQPYSQPNIVPLVHDAWQRLQLLLYHPQVQQFQIYSLSKYPGGQTNCICKEHIVELIIDGLLLTNNNTTNSNNTTIEGGNRSYHKPLQIVFDTIHDHLYYPCMDDPKESCSQKQYAPIITVSSVPRNPYEAPFVHQFPIKQYNNCLYRYRNKLDDNPSMHRRHNRMNCVLEQLKEFKSTVDAWDSLLPQIYWRGTSLDFLGNRRQYSTLHKCNGLAITVRNNITTTTAAADAFAWHVADLFLQQPENLTPRCHAVAMTIKAEAEQSDFNSSSTVNDTSHRFIHHRSGEASRNSSRYHMPWINVKYMRNRYHTNLYGKMSSLFLGDYTPPNEMAKYKYQIDFGGMGGTTWLGTITKLAMPGLLFHHVTPTKDWFYDEIQPWVHYVPIHTNLSNLYDMFVWAETHPTKAKQIAQKGQEYAWSQISPEQYDTAFETLFVPRVQQIAAAYQPQPGETVASILEEYRANNVSATLIGTCDEIGCNFSR